MTGLVILLIVGLLLALSIEGISYLLGRRVREREKLEAFECGFDSLESSRDRFDVKFYLVGMLFIIFDIEASYLFPWAYVMENIGSMGIIGMIDFILELVLGVIFIYRVGVFDVGRVKSIQEPYRTRSERRE